MPMRDYSLPGSRPDHQMALTERQLLQAVVECARYVFNAAASSIFLVDAQTRELVFEAVAGDGADHLPGSRFPPSTGIVGWVAVSGEPTFVDDLAQSSHFDVTAARSTGYVPNSLMAAPLIRSGDCIGVLEVLDRATGSRGELADLDLLGLIGTQAAISLDLLVRARQAEGTGALTQGQADLVDRIREGLRLADASTAALATKMLSAVEEMLTGNGCPPGTAAAVLS